MARQRVEGKTARLHLEPHRLRDRYDRLLAYVELPDGKLLNEEMLAAGLARADSRWPHRNSDRFKLIEAQARRDRLGLWHERSKRTNVETEPAPPADEPGEDE